MKILLLEDDRLFNETIRDFLEDEGFDVDSVLDPLSAYDLVYESRYDLYIFDINLPFEDGISALKSLRSADDNTPAIFITSRDDKESLLKGFKVGADDYLKKPIDLDELLARVKVIRRRYNIDSTLKVGDYIFNFSENKLYLNGNSLKLSLKESELLSILIKNRGRVVEYSEIYNHLWGSQEPNYGALRVYISSLKRYFPNIKSIRSVGYKFNE